MTSQRIINALSKALDIHGACRGYFAALHSIDDTMSDDECAEMIEQLNEAAPSPTEKPLGLFEFVDRSKHGFPDLEDDVVVSLSVNLTAGDTRRLLELIRGGAS